MLDFDPTILGQLFETQMELAGVKKLCDLTSDDLSHVYWAARRDD